LLNFIKIRLSQNKINVAKISSGNLVGQVITIITLPFIARIYGAEIFGIWSLLLSIATFARSFNDLGLINSIMIEDEENVEVTYQVITTVVTFSSIVLSFLITNFLLSYIINVKFNKVILFLIIFLLLFTLKQLEVCHTWLNRKSEYSILMKNPIIQQSVYCIFAIILGLVGFKLYGYFIGQVIGRVAALIYMKNYVPKKMFTWKIIDYKNTISRHRRFLKYQMPSSMLFNFQNQIPIFLFQALWGTKILGYYSMTIKMLQAPISLIANSIGRVFFQITTAMKRDEQKIGEYVYRNLNRAMKILIIPMIFLIVFGDILTIIFFGIEWKMTGYFFQILAIKYFFVFLTQALRGLPITLDRQNYDMVSNIFQIIGCLLGALIGKYLFDNVYISLILMSIFFIIINIIYFAELFKVMKISSGKYISDVLLSISSIIIISFILRYTLKHLGLIELFFGLFNIEV